jgi:hypothetical protein
MPETDEFRETLVGLFTEIAIVEHLARTRLENTRRANGIAEAMPAAHFGILNYFIRNHDGPDTVAGIAWAFQDPEELVRQRVDTLVGLGYLSVIPAVANGQPLIGVTDEGRAAHDDALDVVGPEIMELVAEIPREDLDRTFRTLREIRLTLDNLPDR